jgi:hypothetical protein
VLRDGVQAHWDSNGAGEMVGPDWPTSASPRSAGDSFDVIMADGAYLNTYGVFTLAQPVTGGDTSVVVQTSALLDNGNAGHLAQVQQLFPPGTFFVISRPPPTTGNPFRPERQGQCALLQITGDVTPGPGSAQDWSLPVANISGFNRNLAALLENDDNGDVDASGTCPPEVPSCDDWNPTADNVAGSTVLPLGRLRWSRYEIDYTIPTLPYLVRYDIIGYQEGIDPDGLGGNGTAYPYCTGGACPGPQLHLPGGDSPPRAVAVGPMIEDMQVAVGCDGYTAISAGDAPMGAVPAPDLTFEEVGSAVGPLAGAPNNTVDENPSGSDRDRDEWLGNARAEQWAPDCVWHGTAQYAAAGWLNAEGTPARSRMSPQSIRVTLVGSSEFAEEAGGLSTLTVLPVEDRPGMESSVGARQRFTLTERFTPDNLRWRDPSVQ